MAIKIDGVKKKAKVTNINFSDEKYTGKEPQWDYDRALAFSDEEFDHHLRKSLAYYNYYYGPKDLKKYVVAWLRQHEGDSGVHKLNKTTIDLYARSADTLTPFTVCALVKANAQGMPLRDKHVEYLLNTVKEVIKMAEQLAEDDDAPTDSKQTASKTDVRVPTIQDRMNAIADKHQLHFLELEDRLFAGETVDPKAYDYLFAKSVAPATLSRILAPFEQIGRAHV